MALACLALAATGLVGPFATPAAAEEPRGYKYAEFVINLNDTNRDGVLTYGEMDQTGREYFEEIDVNEDGVADADELASWYDDYAR